MIALNLLLKNHGWLFITLHYLKKTFSDTNFFFNNLVCSIKAEEIVDFEKMSCECDCSIDTVLCRSAILMNVTVL